MRYLVAVSGGVDSVVLLHKLTREGAHELIVAHFDHGIRDDSAADSRFVGELAKKYQLPFVRRREELGVNASEERARSRRYAFLRAAAEDHEATIVTAHHGDDVIETIAINLMRGTGWRGGAVLDGVDIVRPLLDLTKNEIRMYALEHRLEWVEDSTNATTAYLRNRVRRDIAQQLSGEDRQTLWEMWRRQLQLKRAIDTEARLFIQDGDEYSRHLFTQLDSGIGSELLRAIILARNTRGITRPQAERAILAIKTARATTQYEVNGHVRLHFTTRSFIVETP